jgi:kynureninase
MIIRPTAERLDSDDPLARWRDEFVLPDPELMYLDGNSLGRTPKRTVDEVRHVIESQWAGDLITSWWENGWLDMPLTVGDALAPLIGAGSGEVAVHDSTTVCLFQLVNVGLDLTGGTVIAVAETEFPTDRYVIDGIARLRPDVTIRRGLGDLDGVDVVVRSLVDYRTAELHDLDVETRRARAAGAVTVWDLSHAAGVVEVDLTGAGAELAAGCTYKFLNGGPGAPAFTFVRSSVLDRVTQPIWGWFGQRDQFAMDNPFDPRPGIGKLLNGTPGILGLVAARCGIELSAEAGIAAIATKAHALSNFAIDLATELGLHCPTARPPVSSGGHVSILHPDASRLQQELAARKVIVDKRDPDVLRFGLSPLTTRFVDVHDALAVLAEIVG